MVGMDGHHCIDHGGHVGGVQSVSLLCVSVLYGQFNMGDRGPTLEREFVGCPECRIDLDIFGRINMGIELIVFATVFTLIVLLTGGPGPGAS